MGKDTGYQYEFFMDYFIPVIIPARIQIDIKWNKNPSDPTNITSANARIIGNDGNNVYIIPINFTDASNILIMLLPLMTYWKDSKEHRDILKSWCFPVISSTTPINVTLQFRWNDFPGLISITSSGIDMGFIMIYPCHSMGYGGSGGGLPPR